MNKKKIIIIYMIIIIFAIIGEIKCIDKMIKCNWDPVGKAEVIYTAATFTGAGSLVGWFDIKDE